MDLQTALTAGDAAVKIKARNDMVALINAALAGDFRVSRLTAIDPSTGGEVSLILDTLDHTTSQTALGFALQVYQGQLDALTAQLGAL